jgi:hypothetical protein
MPCYDGARLTDFTWTSSNHDIALVTSTGELQTTNAHGTVDIKAQHKTTGDSLTITIDVDSVFDNADDFQQALEDREDLYGSNITKLINYLDEIDSSNDSENILKDKCDVLQAVEKAYIQFAEIDADENFTSSQWSSINSGLDSILYYNFFGNGADNMLEDLNNFYDDVSEADLTDDLNDLEDSFVKNYLESAEIKYEHEVIPFRDAEDTEWYTPYINFAKNEGVVSGYKDAVTNTLTGYYGPSDNITVAELLKMAIESAGLDQKSYECTDADRPACDIMNSHWANQYYDTAKWHNFYITQETQNFDPNRPARREEVVRTFLEAFERSYGNSCSTSFSDVPSSNVYSCYIEEARDLGIVSGDDYTNNFRPTDSINRAEVAKIVQKTIETL